MLAINIIYAFKNCLTIMVSFELGKSDIKLSI